MRFFTNITITGALQTPEQILSKVFAKRYFHSRVLLTDSTLVHAQLSSHYANKTVLGTRTENGRVLLPLATLIFAVRKLKEEKKEKKNKRSRLFARRRKYMET